MTFTPVDHVFVNKKHEVMSGLIEKVLNLLEKGEVSLKESHGIAGFILDSIKEVRDHTQLVSFLHTMKEKWPHFNDLYTIHSKGSVKNEESKMISKLELIINQTTN